MKTLRARKHTRFIIALQKAGLDAQQRHELVYSWTKARTSSSKDLTEQELDDLNWKLSHDVRFLSNADHSIKDALKSKRSIVLSIATRVGIHDTNDWCAFNNFMKSASIHKKALNTYKIDELDALITQLRGVERNYNKSAETYGTKAHRHKFNIPMTILN